eukprot:8353775-Pyramimonas_sp.AAC.1
MLDPYARADLAMDEWEAIWTSGDARWLSLPGDAHLWPALPLLDGQHLRDATLTFSKKTAAGHGKMHP